MARLEAAKCWLLREISLVFLDLSFSTWKGEGRLLPDLAFWIGVDKFELCRTSVSFHGDVTDSIATYLC